MWRSVPSDPGWLARAIAWRTVALYGLLPDGYLLIHSIVPVDWAIEWRRYLYWRLCLLLLLGLTALTLLLKAQPDDLLPRWSDLRQPDHQRGLGDL